MKPFPPHQIVHVKRRGNHAQAAIRTVIVAALCLGIGFGLGGLWHSRRVQPGDRGPGHADEVAVNTEETDLRKAAIYAEAGVKEYWVVEPRNKRITVFRTPQGRAYGQSTVFEGAQTVVCAALPGFEVSLPGLVA